MNRQQFAEFLINPDLTDAFSVPMFEELTERFPYCQPAQLLYAYNLYKADSLRYPVQLKKAAAYAGDRRMLKRLIESARTEVEEITAGAAPVLSPDIENIPVETFADMGVSPFGVTAQRPCDNSRVRGRRKAFPRRVALDR